MDSGHRDAESALVDHVVASTGLPAAQASRVIGDVVAFYAEPVEAFVRRRHDELQRRGVRNAQIFARLPEELARRPVRAPVLTERQLRRIVYG